ncbi:MAG: hypothetical protein ACRDRN_25255 [Sciscionella sp.]
MAEQITDLDALVDLTEIRDVVYHMVSADRAGSDWPESPDEPDESVDADEDFHSSPAEPDNDVESDAPEPGMTVMIRWDDEELGIRCKTFFAGGSVGAAAVYGVDVEAMFSLARPVSIPPQIMQEFIERVGLMALWPYVRSAVASGAAQLSLPAPPLRLLRPKDIIVPIHEIAEPAPEEKDSPRPV